MPDDPALRRQWILLKALSSSRLGLTVRALAEDLGVTEKTVRRDLARFRGLGFPLEERVGAFGRKSWRIAPAGDQPPLSFSFDEAAALYLGRRLLDPLAGTAFGDAARRAAEKVRATLGRAAREYLDRFAGLFHPTAVGVHDYAGRAELIDALQVAIEDGRATRLCYHSERAAGPADREVHPYGLLYHRGALYLIALDPRDERVKHYKVDRIEAAELLAHSFPRPPDFDPRAHLASSFGAYQRDGTPVTVKVRFSPAAARYVRESRWHAEQRLAPQPDGSVLAEFRLTSTEELKRWVLGFGAKAVVLEPESLRREIAEELRSLVPAYEAAGPDGGPRPVPEPTRRPSPPRQRSGAHADD
jgi:predicted DNA-binding transcriptional regulator YafY